MAGRKSERWQDENGVWHEYPREWQGKWTQSGEPGGEPSHAAKVRAWKVLLDWAATQGIVIEQPEAAAAAQEAAQ